MAWNVQLPDAEWVETHSPTFPQLISEVAGVKEIAIDTETTGLTVWKDIPLFWSLSYRDAGNKYRRICMPAGTLMHFQNAFNDPNKRWILANAKYDMHILDNVGIRLMGTVIDVQVMHAMIYEEQSHALKDMAKQVLGWRWTDFDDTFQFATNGKLTKNSSIAEVALGGRFQSVQDAILWCASNDRSKLVEYASNDAYGTFRLYEKLSQELANTPAFSLYNEQFSNWNGREGRIRLCINNQLDLFEQVEAPFTKVLWQCERNGILVDADYLNKAAAQVKVEIDKLEQQAWQLNGAPINMNSPKQVAAHFSQKNLKALTYTKGGKSGVKSPSYNHEFLEHYAGSDAMAAVMLRHRDLSKLHNTYLCGLPEHMDNNGRIHTRLNQDLARTGRLSSSNPNLQNIPKAENDKFKIRNAFVAPENWSLIDCDYDQVEMRLLGAASLEPSMIKIFESGKDIHMGNAELVFGYPYDDIKRAKKMTEDEWKALSPRDAEHYQKCLHSRSAIKTIGFGLNYGMKEKLLASKIGCSVSEAEDVIERYMAALPAVKQFYADAIAECRQTGYSFTLLGRRRFLPEISAKSNYDRYKAERQAVNNQIQGTAADAAKLAMLNCSNADLLNKYCCRMLLQVHDELIFEVPDETANEAYQEIRLLMENPFPSDLAVTLSASGGIGKTWGEAKG